MDDFEGAGDGSEEAADAGDATSSRSRGRGSSRHLPDVHAAHPTTESAAASAEATDLGRLLTHEDIDRARDRYEVARARRTGRWRALASLRVLWLLVGPGILVFLGENDAPSMLSYSADGARYGIGFFLPFVVLTFV